MSREDSSRPVVVGTRQGGRCIIFLRNGPSVSDLQTQRKVGEGQVPYFRDVIHVFQLLWLGMTG